MSTLQDLFKGLEEIQDGLNAATQLAKLLASQANPEPEEVEEEWEVVEGQVKEKRQVLTTLTINRYFDASSVLQGRSINVITELSFPSPVVPSSTVWLNNYADNVGGSNGTNGPLTWNSTHLLLTQNLAPATVQQAFVGNSGFTGCQRFWATGPSYPGPNSFGTNVWRPLNPGTLTKLVWSTNFAVANNATPGLVLGTVSRATPVNNANYTADKFMINIGSGLNLNVLTGSTSLPAQMYRTCTILEGTDTVPTDDE
jgi:hypothetical protein